MWIAIISAVGVLLAGLGAIGFKIVGQDNSNSYPPSPSPSVALAPDTTDKTPPQGSPMPNLSQTATMPLWRGPVELSYSGLNFDQVPPGPGVGMNGLAFSYKEIYDPNGSDKYFISAWTENSLPSSDACKQWVQTHPNSSYSNPAIGDQLCVLTAKGHTVYLHVTQIDESNNGLFADAIVW
jgi:hypothetical protein